MEVIRESIRLEHTSIFFYQRVTRLASTTRWSVLGEAPPSHSDCESVKSQSFSFSRERQAFHLGSQGDMNAASLPVDVQPLPIRRTQQVDHGVNQRRAAVCQAVARRMLSHLDNSEALKVGTKEFSEASER